ncbi:breast cancer type 1 susceptibility protein homolog [Nephila pilipes]|uniref:Breast cancer type 1 susceptibility protein homolog n=1 Tax=Nephila pilipes TaxID=299642 RepID=A0A8X6TI99_NEPPI|nr:breast cancer type 1 susceptibility protein homolog [Nephila pilipes]
MLQMKAEDVKNNINAILKTLECAICLELLKNPVSTGCGHFFCRFCITEVLKSSYRTPCPLCKKSFTRRGIQEAPQRNSIISAAKKLAEACGNFAGIDFFPQKSSQTDDGEERTLSCTSISNNQQIVSEKGYKTSSARKRKSHEKNDEDGIASDDSSVVSDIRSLGPQVEKFDLTQRFMLCQQKTEKTKSFKRTCLTLGRNPGNPFAKNVCLGHKKQSVLYHFQNPLNSTRTKEITLNSFFSEDITNMNSSEIAMEIEDLDKRILSVVEKLKQCGREDLLKHASLEKLNIGKSISSEKKDVNDISGDSEDSTDIFSQSVPPTPPDVVNRNSDSVFKPAHLNHA